eukprot:4069388-Alexandrium_andersonii.AAC.1
MRAPWLVAARGATYWAQLTARLRADCSEAAVFLPGSMGRPLSCLRISKGWARAHLGVGPGRWHVVRVLSVR